MTTTKAMFSRRSKKRVRLLGCYQPIRKITKWLTLCNFYLIWRRNSRLHAVALFAQEESDNNILACMPRGPRVSETRGCYAPGDFHMCCIFVTIPWGKKRGVIVAYRNGNETENWGLSTQVITTFSNISFCYI